MIPRITHSRSQLFSYLNDFEDGACVFGVSCDTYPQLFELAHPDIVQKAPSGWKLNQKGNCRYLWFPPDALDEDDIANINDWRERFEQYVLLGINRHIEDHFGTELDFCMALDYNYNPEAERRTYYGEAEYQLKYQQSRQHLNALRAALVDALEDLPIPSDGDEAIVITSVPADPEECNVARKLAKAVAVSVNKEYIQADLVCDKSAMKELTIENKIPEWENLYASEGCVELHGDVTGKTVIIIDDLYQSGATMWCYAKFLKQQGARCVLGLPCVKSLRDTDNQ